MHPLVRYEIANEVYLARQVKPRALPLWARLLWK